MYLWFCVSVFYFLCPFLIAVWLIYDIVLVSGVQPSDSKTLSIILHLKILKYMSRISCVVQYVPAAYLFYAQ